MPGHRPELSGVLETTLYHDPSEAERMHAFYGDVLGLPAVAGWGDGTAFRIGHGVVILFDREKLAARGGPISAHGTRGAGHVAFTAAPGSYEGWQTRLREHGVEISHRHEWDAGRSFYFSDPAGNLLEIAEADIWPQPDPA